MQITVLQLFSLAAQAFSMVASCKFSRMNVVKSSLPKLEQLA